MQRLSIVADFDRVPVLGGGVVADVGVPGEVWTREGAFRGLWVMYVRVHPRRGVLDKVIMGKEGRL